MRDRVAKTCNAKIGQVPKNHSSILTSSHDILLMRIVWRIDLKVFTTMSLKFDRLRQISYREQSQTRVIRCHNEFEIVQKRDSCNFAAWAEAASSISTVYLRLIVQAGARVMLVQYAHANSG